MHYHMPYCRADILLPGASSYVLSFPLIFRCYDYNTLVEGLLPANLCLVPLLRSGKCTQFENFPLQHGRIVNKIYSFKTKLIVNNI